ncbi:hypothetical protein QQ045_007832 [Rhodiola kirilowii]
MEMPTLDNLDVPFMDEYDREEMENLHMVAIQNPQYENAQPHYVWDHPDFEDILAWQTNQPVDEYLARNFGQPDLHEDLGFGSWFESKELVIQALRKWSIMHRVEYGRTLRCDRGAEIQERILKDYGFESSYLKAWKAKQQTMINLFGTWDGSFAYLPHLMKALVDASPETIVKWDTEEIDGEYIQVNRVFWAFAECIHAIKHCRPILSIDGTHMYGKYDGKLLVACSLDANNGVLPITFALVESENTSSWSWFMRCICEGVTSCEGLCTDRHEGIMAAMKEPEWSPPMAYHRICVHHFQSNFNTKVKDSFLKKKLGKVAYAKKEYKFAAEYEELMKLMRDRPDVRMWLRNVVVPLWSLAMDAGGMRWGSMTTNALELFNGVLKHGHDLPISALLNKYFNNRHYRYDNLDSGFVPKVHQRLEVLRQRAQFHRVIIFNPSRGIYEVTTGIKHHLWKVCLPERTCNCGKWTLHIPCSHAIAAFHYLILTSGNPMMDFLIGLILTSNVQKLVEIRLGNWICGIRCYVESKYSTFIHIIYISLKLDPRNPALHRIVRTEIQLVKMHIKQRWNFNDKERDIYIQNATYSPKLLLDFLRKSVEVRDSGEGASWIDRYDFLHLLHRLARRLL